MLKLRDELNKTLEDFDKTEHVPDSFSDIDKPKTHIRGIRALERGTFLLDLDSQGSANRFRSYTDEHTFFLPSILGTSATIIT